MLKLNTGLSLYNDMNWNFHLKRELIILKHEECLLGSPQMTEVRKS